VKTMKNLCLAILTLGLLATPVAAQKTHSNKGGAARGDVRADKVKGQGKKNDKDHDPSPDNDKNKGNHNGETQGKRVAKGHRP